MPSVTHRIRVAAVAVLVTGAGCGALAIAGGQKSTPPPSSERLAAAAKHGVNIAVTVLPVHLQDAPNRDVGEALGLVLEKNGLPNVYAGDAPFAREGDAFDDALAALAVVLRTSPAQTDYVLYAEFLGTPQTGPTEIRAALLDRAGELIWREVQKPDDAEFKRARPREPMTCCVLVAERLCDALKIAKPQRRPVSDGRMAQLWEAKSGMPRPAERDAMKARLAALKARDARSVTVLPLFVGGRRDAQAATGLAKALTDSGLCSATAAEAGPAFEPAPTSNEQKRLWELARTVRTFVQETPQAIRTDYVLCADYTMKPGGAVHTAHFVICDRSGDWVIVDFQNEHQADFRRLAPQDTDGAGRLVVARLRGYLN
ncbi:MAG TPA: hypothetical protein PKC49_12340 [Phycisphaerae bacterium]|nr:hypothetical protein [Phycisphaerae bacterium]